MNMRFIALLLLLITTDANATALIKEPLTDDKAVQCLMGEARGEDYEAIVAHGEALRNRQARYGRLWGVDGCKWQGSEPQWVWDRVRLAWEESKTSDKVHGADHWYADYIPMPNWAKRATMTAKYGRTKFYKNVK